MPGFFTSVLKSLDPPILSVFLEWSIENMPTELCTKSQMVELLNLFLDNHFVPVRDLGQNKFKAFDNMPAFIKAFTRTSPRRFGEIKLPGNIFWINTRVAPASLMNELTST